MNETRNIYFRNNHWLFSWNIFKILEEMFLVLTTPDTSVWSGDPVVKPLRSVCKWSRKPPSQQRLVSFSCTQRNQYKKGTSTLIIFTAVYITSWYSVRSKAQRAEQESSLGTSSTYSGRCQSAVVSHQDVWICRGNKTYQSKQRERLCAVPYLLIVHVCVIPALISQVRISKSCNERRI